MPLAYIVLGRSRRFRGIDACLLHPVMLAGVAAEVDEDIYEDVTRRKASREQYPLPAPAAKKAKGGLRARHPW